MFFILAGYWNYYSNSFIFLFSELHPCIYLELFLSCVTLSYGHATFNIYAIQNVSVINTPFIEFKVYNVAKKPYWYGCFAHKWI